MRLSALLFLIFFPMWGQAQSDSKTKIVGDASLLSNYVWHGLTQTKKQPAIQTSMYYYFAPIFRMGLWGSNVGYYESDKANALLKINGDLKLIFTPNFHLFIK